MNENLFNASIYVIIYYLNIFKVLNKIFTEKFNMILKYVKV